MSHIARADKVASHHMSPSPSELNTPRTPLIRPKEAGISTSSTLYSGYRYTAALVSAGGQRIREVESERSAGCAGHSFIQTRQFAQAWGGLGR